MYRSLILLICYVLAIPIWGVYNKEVEKSLKKQYKEVNYLAHSDCYLVMSKNDKGFYGVVNSKGKEEISPYYKKIAFEKNENGEVIIFALNPNYKAHSQGNIVYSFQRGEILDLGKNEPIFIIGGFITSYLLPIYNLEGQVVLDCQQTSIQPLRYNLEIIGYRVGTRTRNNDNQEDQVIICDTNFRILFSLKGANYLWSIAKHPISSTEIGWRCSRKVDTSTTIEYLYTKDGRLITDKELNNETSMSSLSVSLQPKCDNQKETQTNLSKKTDIKLCGEQAKILSVTTTNIASVDTNIPIGNTHNQSTFALVIANENYQEVADVPNAINDGIIFAEYCKKTLGIPSENIHLIKNATLNNIKRELNLMEQIAEAYFGEANFIVYYAGHGIPDESSASSYILPVDGYTSDLSTCLSLSDFYTRLAKYPSNKILVFMDACFSGSLRGDGMLQAARGVVLKAKQAKPTGKMVVFSAAQGDETAYPLEKEKHGLFTYWLLKNIKDSKGNISLGDLADNLINSVGKQSLVINGKKQTPSIQTSLEVKDDWRTWMLNE